MRNGLKERRRKAAQILMDAGPWDHRPEAYEQIVAEVLSAVYPDGFKQYESVEAIKRDLFPKWWEEEQMARDEIDDLTDEVAALRGDRS